MNQLDEKSKKLLQIFQLLGLQYFSIKKLIESKASKTPSNRQTVCGFLIILLLVSLLAIQTLFASEITQTVNARNVLNITINHLMRIGLYIIAITSVFKSLTLSCEEQKFFLAIEKINEIVRQDLETATQNQKTKFIYGALITVPLTMAFFSALLTSGLGISENFNIYMIILAFLLPTLLFSLLSIEKFLLYVNVINNLLEDLNLILKMMVNDNKLKTSMKSTHLVRLVEPKVSNRDILREVLAVRKVYNLIYVNGQIVEDVQGVIVLFHVILAYVIFISKGYQLFTIYIGTSHVMLLPGTCCSVVFAILMLLSIVWNCQKTQNTVSA
jgi:hypothetical protein